MNRCAVLIFAASLASALQAQGPNAVIAEQRQAYNAIKNNLIKAAEKMPESDYDFKATPDVRTFGQLIMHVAQAQMGTCAAVKGEQKRIDASKTAKPDAVASLKASFDECDAAWDSMGDAGAHEMITLGRGGQRSKIGALVAYTIVHSNEEYGYLAVYLRLKGIVPPSSER